MSNITKETINKVAKLANIKITEDENLHLTTQLTKITNWVESLNEVNTDGVEILNNVHNIELALFPDKIQKTNEAEDVLKNATNPTYNYFTVPKVIE